MYRTHRRSQTSVEFIIVLVILLFVFIFLFSIYIDSAREVSIRKENAAAKRIVDTLALGINDVYISGKSQTITIPTTILGRETYSLVILEQAHVVSLEWLNGYYSYPIITSNVSYTTLEGGTLTISYVDGEVIIS